jgi:hypothetical protein
LGAGGLLANREKADEYGWRNFGDVFADHEQAYYGGDEPLVSHYNNQFDMVQGFLLHYLRTGDRRWFELGDALARHVMDIDIYHTQGGQGGVQRRTVLAHGPLQARGGRDASDVLAEELPPRRPLLRRRPGERAQLHDGPVALPLSDRRPRRPRGGAGAGGLGDGDGRRPADGAGAGRRRPDRAGEQDGGGRLSRTGARGGELAQCPRSTRGRCRVSGSILTFAETLIRRCIHPADDVAGRDLLDVERRWSYTVFLTSLDKYLDVKAEAGELDRMFAYGRESLLHYARWMRDHEKPYFDQVEKLEYPTEAWAAQELRKANVLRRAARRADEPLRSELFERGDELAERAWRDLWRFETRANARATAIVMTEGLLDCHLREREAAVVPSGRGIVRLWASRRSLWGSGSGFFRRRGARPARFGLRRG